MKNKKLKNLIKLSSSIKIYIPSTVEINKTIDNSKYVDDCLSFLSVNFGGATSFSAIGCWQTQEKNLVKEKVTICQSYCKQDTLEENIDAVIDYCESLKKELNQEAISLEINNELYFI